MTAIAAGDEQAYTELYHTYSPNIFRVAMTYTRNDTSVAEELVQTIFIKVWEKRAKLEGVTKIEDYLFVLARNTIFDHLKKEARKTIRHNHLYAVQPASENNTELALMQKEYTKILQHAIDRLPPQQRKIYLLAKQEGLPHDEIARRLSLATSTVHTHVKLGTRSVQKYVDSHLAGSLILIASSFIF